MRMANASQGRQPVANLSESAPKVEARLGEGQATERYQEKGQPYREMQMFGCPHYGSVTKREVGSGTKGGGSRLTEDCSPVCHFDRMVPYGPGPKLGPFSFDRRHWRPDLDSNQDKRPCTASAYVSAIGPIGCS